jgi:hypothetical protein
VNVFFFRMEKDQMKLRERKYPYRQGGDDSANIGKLIGRGATIDKRAIGLSTFFFLLFLSTFIS